MPRSFFADLFAYNDWANDKIMHMSSSLDDSQLDRPRPLGFGSLRATLYHLLVAEELWQDRWEQRRWERLKLDHDGVPLADIARRFTRVRERRAALLEDRQEFLGQFVHYKNTEEKKFSHTLSDLLIHVANHGVHHRAQALNYLRDFGKTVKGGLDYLFYRLAHPSIQNSPDAIEAIEKRKIEMGFRLVEPADFDADLLRQYCRYGNWAMHQVLQIGETMGDRELDHEFKMGAGSVRLTLLHILDSERWWYSNWNPSAGGFHKSEPQTSIQQLVTEWQEFTSARDAYLQDLSSAEMSNEVFGTIAGAKLRFRMGESVVQLCGHGTHHRAQVSNMFRQLGQTSPPLDYVQWIRFLESRPKAAAT